jgi:trafficking protein particle complex subunit 9
VPEPRSLSLTVVDPQPLLRVQSPNLTQPSLMLLEGEKRTVALHLKNESRTVSSDFLLLSSNDNVSRDLRSNLSRKDIQPIDTYEVQHQLKHRPVVHISSGQYSSQDRIEPGESETYEVDVWGRPGLTDASVHIDFANLKKPRSEISQTFYTRQVRFPIALTVNGSIDIVRCNVLPVQGDLPQRPLFTSEIKGIQKSNGLEDQRKSSISGSNLSSSGLCMLSLDLRNVWPQPLAVKLRSSRQAMVEDQQGPAEGDDEGYTVSEVIQPGHISRVILLVPQVYVENPFAPIPNLDIKKQFVVTASKLSPEAEAATRENFWYREAILKHLSGTWEEVSTGRTGEIDIRKGIRLNLNARMIEALRIDPVEVSYTLVPNGGVVDEHEAIKELESSHYSLQTDVFATLRVKVRNLSQTRLPLLVRVQPSLRAQPHNIALDLSRRLAWSGLLQRVLHPPLEPGGEQAVELGLLAFAAGLYDINVTIEEVTPRSRLVKKGSEDLDLDGQRRIWHARAPCLIDAIDPPLPLSSTD